MDDVRVGTDKVVFL